MEDIPVSYKGHKILHDFKGKLESRFKVKICMPVLQDPELCASGEIIFVKIIGTIKNIKCLQRFLNRKLSNEGAVDNQETDESVIVLSDSDDVCDKDTGARKPPKKKRCTKKFPAINSGNQSPACEISSTTNTVRYLNNILSHEVAVVSKKTDESVIVLNSDSDDVSSDSDDVSSNSNDVSGQDTDARKPPKKRRCTEKLPVVNSGNQSPACEISSTTNAVDESVIILDEPTAMSFIPICTDVPSYNEITTSPKILPATDKDIIVISSDEEDTVSSAEQLVLPKVIPAPRRLLRPIVIDGSNIARSHGKPQNTFSCKGIEIAVNYFLKRGHPQVTAVVPLYRKHCKYGPILTTDQEILVRLERTQNVVFSPSRRVDGRAYSCYDDRFIVELAAINGGVILSNDNFKDLLEENPEAFSDAIKNRLLMYCFVGDILLIPADPLGSRGPKLDEYLSFPPEVLDSGS